MTEKRSGTENTRVEGMLRHLANKAVDLAFSKLGFIKKAVDRGKEEDIEAMLKEMGEGGDAEAKGAEKTPEPASAAPATPPIPPEGSTEGAPVKANKLNERAENMLKKIGNPIIENDMRRKIVEFSPEGQNYFLDSYFRNLETIKQNPAFANQAHDAAYAESWKDFQTKYQMNPITKRWDKKPEPVSIPRTPATPAGQVAQTSQEAIPAMAGSMMEFDGKAWIVRHASLKEGKAFKTMEEAGRFLTMLAESETVAEGKPAETAQPAGESSSTSNEEKPNEVTASSQGGKMAEGVRVQAETSQSGKGVVKGLPTSTGSLAGGHGKFPKASGTVVTETPMKTGIEAGAGAGSMKQSHEGKAAKSDAEIKRLNGQHGLMSEITKLCSTEDGMEMLNEALRLVVAAKKKDTVSGQKSS